MKKRIIYISATMCMIFILACISYKIFEFEIKNFIYEHVLNQREQFSSEIGFDFILIDDHLKNADNNVYPYIPYLESSLPKENKIEFFGIDMHGNFCFRKADEFAIHRINLGNKNFAGAERNLFYSRYGLSIYFTKNKSDIDKKLKKYIEIDNITYIEVNRSIYDLTTAYKKVSEIREKYPQLGIYTTVYLEGNYIYTGHITGDDKELSEQYESDIKKHFNDDIVKYRETHVSIPAYK